VRTTLKITLASTVLAFAASLAVYAWLPETVPIHFDLAGNPNGFASRFVGAFLLPAFMLILVGIGSTKRVANPAIGTAAALVSTFFLVLHGLMLRAALTAGGLGNILWFVMGLFFVALGLVLPRVRRNRWVGVRTPWSMSSPEAWARSQRGGGYAMIVAGVLIALSSAWTGVAAYALRLFAILGAAIVSIVYSYIAARPAAHR
jgi:uncharacterized membrane protein